MEGGAQPLKDLKETQDVWSCREGGRECQKISLEMDTGQITQGFVSQGKEFGPSSK